MKKILSGMIILCSVFVYSCKYHPGASQPPKSSSITINNPAYGMYDMSNHGLGVGIKTILKVITGDANNNLVVYPPGPYVKYYNVSSTNPFLDASYSYDIMQPQGATKFAVDITIETLNCGWPVPNHTWNGGEVTWAYITPAYTYPANPNIYYSQLAPIYEYQCQ